MARVQYSLASLFELTVACAALLSPLVMWVEAAAAEAGGWRVLSASFGGWAVLLVIYARHRHWGILILHGLLVGLVAAVAAFFGLVLLFDSVISGVRAIEAPGRAALGLLAYAALACFLGMLFSLPPFLWFFFHRRASRAGQENRDE